MAKGNISKKTVVTAIIAVLIIAAIVAGICIHRYNKFMTPVKHKVESISFTQMSQNKELKLIAHRGLQAIAPENTLPAYDRAGEAGYWGAECDIFRTSDGAWVLMHDDKVDRMTDGKGKVEEMTLEELKALNIDNGNNLETYGTVKIPTLEEYLASCKSLNMNAFIELKSENNTEHYDEVVKAVSEAGVEVTYISFFEDDLKAMRKLDEKAPMFLLVNKIDDKAIETAKEIGNCGVDFNVSKKANLKNDGEAVKKLVDSGIPAAAWTVDDIETMQTLVDLGVLYITTDCITY